MTEPNPKGWGCRNCNVRGGDTWPHCMGNGGICLRASVVPVPRSPELPIAHPLSFEDIIGGVLDPEGPFAPKGETKAFPASAFYTDEGKLRIGPTEEIPLQVTSTQPKKSKKKDLPKQPRKSVSIRGESYALLKAKSKELGQSMSGIIEAEIHRFFNNEDE